MSDVNKLKQDPNFMAFYKKLENRFGKPAGFKVETIEQANERWKKININIYED